MKSATGSTLTLTQSTPGGVWQFPWTTDAKQSILAGNFPSCANVYEGDLGAIEHAAASDRFKASRVRYVEDF